MCKVSFVVPVYNVERYLERCVKSLVNQNISSEIILVDDGSTDRSGELADRFSRENENIKVIHRENGGLSAARNTGMRAAGGDFILFVDSDDWLTENSVSTLVETAEKLDLDVAVGDFQNAYDSGHYEANQLPPCHFPEPVCGKEFFKISMEHKRSLSMVWKSIYRREFLLSNNLFFLEGFNHEDEEWTPRVYLAANRVKDVDCVFYNYYLNEKSISKNPQGFAKSSYDLIKICHRLKAVSMEIQDKRLKHLFQNKIAGLYLSAFCKGKLLGRQYEEYVRNDFFRDMSLEKNTKRKAALFRISKHVYYYVNFISKLKRQ